MSRENIVPISIRGRAIGPGHSAYIIAELSANHNQDFELALKHVYAAAEAGADAIKLQTYTADTLTLNVDNEHFKIKGGTLWDGQTLHSLYQTAYTPWEWQPKIKALARELGLHCFSSPFDPTAVDFLEEMNVPAYKIASFEIHDTQLIQRVARTGKPIIISTGIATLTDIERAVSVCYAEGNRQVALLKCTSAYPAAPEEANLRTIPALQHLFGVPVGLSDHTMGLAVPVAAVTLGACIIEKHFILDRSLGGPDAAFSLTAQEFADMVQAVRTAEAALGSGAWAVSPTSSANRKFGRSLFTTRDVKAGEPVSAENVRSVRPGTGLPAYELPNVLGRTFSTNLPMGSPLTWEIIG
jgi:pseudaminic acid synthase